MKKIYIVKYRDCSHRNAEEHIVGIFNNYERADKLVADIEEMKNNFENSNGSCVYIDEYEIGWNADLEYINKHLG